MSILSQEEIAILRVVADQYLAGVFDLDAKELAAFAGVEVKPLYVLCKRLESCGAVAMHEFEARRPNELNFTVEIRPRAVDQIRAVDATRDQVTRLERASPAYVLPPLHEPWHDDDAILTPEQIEQLYRFHRGTYRAQYQMLNIDPRRPSFETVTALSKGFIRATRPYAICYSEYLKRMMRDFPSHVSVLHEIEQQISTISGSDNIFDRIDKAHEQLIALIYALYENQPPLGTAIAQRDAEGKVVHWRWQWLDERPATPRKASQPRKRRPPGRPVDTDATKDRQVYGAWRTGTHKTYEDLGTEMGMSRREVVQAIDRHRKRLARSEERDAE